METFYVIVAFFAGIILGYVYGRETSVKHKLNNLLRELGKRSEHIYDKITDADRLQVFHKKEPKTPEQENLEQVEKELNK